MKKTMYGLLAIAALTATISWKNWETIKGNGNLKKETRDVGSFTGIEDHGSMNVVITYGSSNQITVEADENLLPYIETKVSGNRLEVKSSDKVGIDTRHNITVAVQLKTVTELSVSGSGGITGSGAFSNGSETKLAVSGSGSLNLGFANFNTVKTSISGSGSIKLGEGKVSSIDATISGSGRLNAADIPCQDVKAKISGSGDMKVICNNSLEAHISGSGSVHYKGSATNVVAKTSGSGQVVKI